MQNQGALLPPREPEPLAHLIVCYVEGPGYDLCARCGAWRETGYVSGVYWQGEWHLGETSPLWCPGKGINILVTVPSLENRLSYALRKGVLDG